MLFLICILTRQLLKGLPSYVELNVFVQFRILIVYTSGMTGEKSVLTSSFSDGWNCDW